MRYLVIDEDGQAVQQDLYTDDNLSGVEAGVNSIYRFEQDNFETAIVTLEEAEDDIDAEQEDVYTVEWEKVNG